MGVWRASGKKGYSSGDWKRRIRESSFSRSRSVQSRKLRLAVGYLKSSRLVNSTVEGKLDSLDEVKSDGMSSNRL